MTNLELYIVLSYLIMITPSIRLGGIAGLLVFMCSPISLPIRLGSYIAD
jgi:hypothetical protein